MSETIRGVDGCKAGWLCLAQDFAEGRISAIVAATAAELFDPSATAAVTGIDIPIGLPAAGGRACDEAARRLLGRARSSSVFPVPIRPVIALTDRVEASRLHEAIDGRRIGVQSWNLVAKIREVDDVVRSRPELRGRVREVHPELAFMAWNRGAAMRCHKKTPEGRAERRRLIDRDFGPEAYGRIRAAFAVKEVAHDDILDAFAVLRSARRIRRGEAVVLPEALPPTDAEGLPMEIVY